MAVDMMRNSLDETQRVARYRRLLKRDSAVRPMLGLIWEPDVSPARHLIEDLRPGAPIDPTQIHPEAIISDVEEWFQFSKGLAADTFQPFGPSFGLPWVEAIVGCPIVARGDSLWAAPVVGSLAEWGPIRLDFENPWLRKLIEMLRAMVHLSGGRFPISLPVMRGPLDVLAAMRTPEQMCLDLIDEVNRVSDILLELAHLYVELGDVLLDEVPMFHGGYVTRMHLWAPGRAITPQNDTSTLISRKTYEQLVLPADRIIIEHFPFQSFHLHSSEHHIVDSLLSIDSLTSLEVTLEGTIGGPTLDFMLPILRHILLTKPLVLAADSLDVAERCLHELSAPGLCLLVIPTPTDGIPVAKYGDWLDANCQVEG